MMSVPGEPAVTEHIPELYVVLYAALCHFLHQFYLAHDALLLAAGYLGGLVLHGLVLSGGLPAVQAEFGILVLAAEGEVHQQLADAVAQAAEQALVAPVAAVRHVREYPAHHLYAVAGLDDVRVVEDEHRGQLALLVVAPDGDLSPQLAVDVVHDLAPLRLPVVQELIEHVLVAAHKPEKGRVSVACGIGNAEAREHQQQLKDAQRGIEAVGPWLFKGKGA